MSGRRFSLGVYESISEHPETLVYPEAYKGGLRVAVVSVGAEQTLEHLAHRQNANIKPWDTS